MTLTEYILRRLVGFIPVLLLICLLVSVMLDVVPGDPVILMLGIEAPGEVIAQRRAEMGLERPIYERVGEWFARAVQGDLGKSYYLGQSVASVITERFPVTLSIACAALLIASLIGVPVGVLAAFRHGRLIDWAVMFGALILLSLPSFMLALGLIFLFAVRLGWLPVSSYVALTENPVSYIKHLLLPGFSLGLGNAAVIARFSRTAILEVLGEDYVRVARAKGLRERTVVVRHVLRNGLVPILTIIGLMFGGMLGGAVLIEVVFAMPGIGRTVVDAVIRRDYPLVQGGVLVVTITYLLVNLLTDIIYALVDPRIRY